MTKQYIIQSRHIDEVGNGYPWTECRVFEYETYRTLEGMTLMIMQLDEFREQKESGVEYRLVLSGQKFIA